MLKIIPKLLSGDHLQAVASTIQASTFVDGKISAGKIAERVKNNDEATLERERLDALNRIVMGAYLNNAVFQLYALPYKMAEPYYARYQTGKFYGEHVDDPVMGAENRYRSDLSTTLYLNDSQNYTGGELCLKTPFGEQVIKLQAGDAVVYPSSYLHQVNKVTSGVRFVAVSWIQSLVRSVEQRSLLEELVKARDELSQSSDQSQTCAMVNNCYSNLMRMWSDV